MTLTAIASPLAVSELLGGSSVGRTDKPVEEFRRYTEDAMDGKVKQTYHDINTKQTVEFVRAQHDKWHSLRNGRYTMMEVIDMLAAFVDESDPDTKEAQEAHAFQTAERCRELFPDEEWMHLVGLIHDCGKILGILGQPQWATVGDTWVVGARMADAHTYSEFWAENPDSKDPRHNTKHGMYEPHCGLDNVLMSYGHDEYLYQVLVGNGCPLPPEALYIIRFHSFYAHHQQNAYAHFCNNKDEQLLPWLRKFQKADLYSKSEAVPDMAALRAHYQGLIDKYCGGVLRW